MFSHVFPLFCQDPILFGGVQKESLNHGLLMSVPIQGNQHAEKFGAQDCEGLWEVTTGCSGLEFW
jgi:hypothetical protein